MTDNWKRLQKEVIEKDKRLNGPFNEVTKKVDNLTNVIKDPDGYNTNLASKNSILSLEQQIKELQEQVDYLSLQLTKHISTSPNPYGDDDYATPEDIDLFPGP